MPNYAANMRNNHEALGRLYGEFTKLGIKAFSFESVTPLGLIGCGFADLRGDKFEQDHSVAGQNDFGWWVGSEDMAFDVCMYQVGTRKRSEEELRGIQFRMMANRGFVMMNSLITGNYEIPGWWVTLNHTYEQALPHMKIRRLLPNDGGVRWLDGNTQILWAFRDTAIPVPAQAQVCELVGADSRPVPPGATLAARAGRVYRVVSAG